jgi:hypothetical protein
MCFNYLVVGGPTCRYKLQVQAHTCTRTLLKILHDLEDLVKELKEEVEQRERSEEHNEQCDTKRIRWCEETHDERDWDNWVTVNEATSTPDHLAFSFKTDAAYYEVMLHNINDHWRGDFRAKDFRQVWGGTLKGHGGATKMQGRWEEIQDGYKESFYFELELD